jgi:hypothetical protein
MAIEVVGISGSHTRKNWMTEVRLVQKYIIVRKFCYDFDYAKTFWRCLALQIARTAQCSWTWIPGKFTGHGIAASASRRWYTKTHRWSWIASQADSGSPHWNIGQNCRSQKGLGRSSALQFGVMKGKRFLRFFLTQSRLCIAEFDEDLHAIAAT